MGRVSKDSRDLSPRDDSIMTRRTSAMDESRHRLQPRASILHQRNTAAGTSKFNSSFVGRSSMALRKEIEAVVSRTKSAYSGQRTFHVSWTSFIVFMSFVGGVIMYAIDRGNFVDSLFYSTSSLANSGLTSVKPSSLNKSTFIVSSILQILGSSACLLLPTIAYRIYKLHQLKPSMESSISRLINDPSPIGSLRPTDVSARIHSSICEPRHSEMLKLDALYIQQCLDLYHSSIAAFVVIFFYIFFWLAFGFIFLTICLLKEPLESELRERGFTYFQNGVFCTIAAFSNSGLTLSDNSYSYLNTNSAALVVSSVLILAGNIFLPVFLRMFFVISRKLCARFQLYKWEDALDWALKNPRRITTHLFLDDETMFLTHFSLFSNLVVVILFVAVEVYRQDMKEIYGSEARIFGLGCFQIINLRHCGFTSIAMSDLTQSTQFIFALAMYLSPLPFVSLLIATGKESIRHAEGSPVDDNNKDYPFFGVLRNVFFRFLIIKVALIFVLACFENSLMSDHPDDVNLWYLIFELTSAYGLVGLSVSMPGEATSLSGKFSSPGKLCVIVAGIMGKHRGLPLVKDPIIDFEFKTLKGILQKHSRDTSHNSIDDMAVLGPEIREESESDMLSLRDSNTVDSSLNTTL